MIRKALAVFVATALIAGAMAPGALAATDEDLSVDVSQHDDGSATVTVMVNETAAANASVNVTTVDANATYAGTGTYTADENGTVGLPAPNATVTIDVLAAYDNETASATVELVAENDTEEDLANMTFGERVSALVHGLQNDSNTSGPFGLLVAQFAATQNPGNGQGPPVMAGPGGETDDRGPPEFVTNGDNETERGNDKAERGNDNKTERGNDNGNDDRERGNEDSDDEETERGPPEHAQN